MPEADPLRALEEALLAILVERSYFREHGKQFRLASGRMSDYYIECSLTTTHHRAAPLIGALVHARVPRDAVAIGGPTATCLRTVACCCASASGIRPAAGRATS